MSRFDPEKITNEAALRARDKEVVTRRQLTLDRLNATLIELGVDPTHLANLPFEPETADLLKELQTKQVEDPDNYPEFVRGKYHEQPARVAAAFQLYITTFRDQHGY